MRIGRIEFGLIRTPANDYSRDNRSFEPRTIGWFFRQFKYRHNYQFETVICRCFMMNFGPLFLTCLSNLCNNKSNKNDNNTRTEDLFNDSDIGYGEDY